ncbi:unnamed protein product [Ilex paraguariensis]|uniref:Uncharacterized protein n=1 Tax=Ilex paraguariensis TaxID=185542 RepID=A0ABC8SW07_9AQUA
MEMSYIDKKKTTWSNTRPVATVDELREEMREMNRKVEALQTQQERRIEEMFQSLLVLSNSWKPSTCWLLER